jgi:hypothetical protein
MPVLWSISFIIVIMCGAVAARKPDISLYVFLPLEMLVGQADFEKCNSPLHSWLRLTGTVSRSSGRKGFLCCWGRSELGSWFRSKSNVG